MVSLAPSSMVGPRQARAQSASTAGGFPEYEQYDALGLAELVRAGEIRPVELLDAAASRMEERNPALNAIVFEWVDRARDEIAEGIADGPFKGVPLLLKNLGTAMKDTPLTNGSRLFAGYRAHSDGEIVRRFRRAGLVPFGRGNAPEFGITATTEPAFHGPTHNPWDLSRTPGGSSGGAAAAVAAGILPMAYASDGGGSARIPASCCGLVSMKPTRGRTPVSLGAALGQSLVVSRSVRDLAAALDAIAGPAVGSPFSAPQPERPFRQEVGRRPRQLKIAFSRRSPHTRPLAPDCIAAVEAAAALCESAGHEVSEDQPRFDFAALGQAMFKVVMATGVAATVTGREKALGRKAREDELENYTRAMVEVGRGLGALEYAAGLATIDRVSRRFAAFFDRYDILLTPTLGRPPLPLGELIGTIVDEDEYLDILYGFMPFTMQFNGSGQPAVSLPLHWSPTGLPIGVQFGGRYGDDATLIRLAAQLEEARPWFDRRPEL